MGGYLSQSVDVESAYPNLGTEEHKHKRRFIDPRSPSMDINRTPIMMYEPVRTFIDPRSPSEGIERTPITYQLPQKHGMTCLTNASSHIPDKIPPLCFGDETEGSSTDETNDTSASTIAETDICEEQKNDLYLEAVKILPDEKTETTPEEATVEIMPSPILALVPNEHIIDTPKDDTPTVISSSSIATATTIITSTKFTDSLVSKSKIPTSQLAKKAPVLPSMIPHQALVKKKSDFQPAVKGFGWKKSGGGLLFPAGEGRSPLLNRNGDNNLAFSHFQPNALGKIQPGYRQNPMMRGRSKNMDVENALARDGRNKENVTILWED